MNRCYLFQGVGSSDAPPTSHSRWDSLTQLSGAIYRLCVGSSGAEDPTAKSSLLASTRPSDRPTLPLDQGVGSSGAEDFVLAHLCLDLNWASDRPMVSSLRPSDHPVLLSSLLFLCNSSGASRNLIVGSSDGVNFVWPTAQCTNYIDAMHRWYHRFIRRCPFFFFSFSFLTLEKYTIFSIWHVVFWHPWDLEVYTKTC
jgi:hypothetical protein